MSFFYGLGSLCNLKFLLSTKQYEKGVEKFENVWYTVKTEDNRKLSLSVLKSEINRFFIYVVCDSPSILMLNYKLIHCNARINFHDFKQM